MLHHLVLFRLHPHHQHRAAELVERLHDLRGQIPALLTLSAGQDVLHGAASWDVGLMTTHHDLAGLEAYRVHPLHQAVVVLVQELCAARATVDFEA
jgi:hypothetical protein